MYVCVCVQAVETVVILESILDVLHSEQASAATKGHQQYVTNELLQLILELTQNSPHTDHITVSSCCQGVVSSCCQGVVSSCCQGVVSSCCRYRYMAPIPTTPSSPATWHQSPPPPSPPPPPVPLHVRADGIGAPGGRRSLVPDDQIQI